MKHIDKVRKMSLTNMAKEFLSFRCDYCSMGSSASGMCNDKMFNECLKGTKKWLNRGVRP